MSVVLTRYYRSAVQCRGVLRVMSGEEEVFSCKTLELPWKDNENRISCIPPGPTAETPATYALRRRDPEESGTFDYTHYLVEGVPGRSYILIHAGNLYTQILGCILVGDTFVDINEDGHPDVANSGDTLNELLMRLGEGTDTFTVRWVDQITDAEIPIAEPMTEPDALALPDLSQLPENPETFG